MIGIIILEADTLRRVPYSYARLLPGVLLKPIFLPNLRIFLPVHLTHKHLQGSGEGTAAAVQGLVDHEQFSRLRVLGGADNAVEIAGALRVQLSLEVFYDGSGCKVSLGHSITSRFVLFPSLISFRTSSA